MRCRSAICATVIICIFSFVRKSPSLTRVPHTRHGAICSSSRIDLCHPSSGQQRVRRPAHSPVAVSVILKPNRHRHRHSQTPFSRTAPHTVVVVVVAAARDCCGRHQQKNSHTRSDRCVCVRTSYIVFVASRPASWPMTGKPPWASSSGPDCFYCARAHGQST